jgi:hypothetical protein
MPTDDLRRTPFRAVLLAEAVAVLEHETGPMDDGAALAEAHRAQPTLNGRVTERAWRLARQRGLLAELDGLRRLAWLPLAAGALLMALSAYAILGAVVGEGRSINLVMAFVSVLGLHAAALLLWLAGWPAARRGGVAGIARPLLALGRRWLSRDKLALLQAGETIVRREGLAPWVFGLFSHAVWSLAFLLVLAGLVLAFAFHAFRLGWETTILDADFFAGFVRIAGWGPALLGFPSAEPALQPGLDAAQRHRLLAWWLIGCTVAYGLLPRVLLALLCGLVWRRRARQVQVDPAAPWVRRLASRFDRLDASTIVDADPGRAAHAGGTATAPPPTGALALVGFELPPEAAWPIEPFTTAAAWSRRIEGREDERQALADSVTAQAPGRLLVAVDGAASPDRGTGHVLRSLGPQDRAVALLLLDQPGRRTDARRWRTWLRDEDLAAITLLPDTAAARRWAGLDERDG